MTERKDITQIRAHIDRVDATLLKLIAERLELASEVRQAKSGVQLWRPSREQSLVCDLANKAGTIPPELVSRIWAELVSASLSLQGQMRLHISLDGDQSHIQTLIRDRFGGALPQHRHPTPQAALMAAYAEDEGVAIVPAPSSRNNWWINLCANGALSDMHILAALPRVGTWDWPEAVAVSTAEIAPSVGDQTIIALTHSDACRGLDITCHIRAEANTRTILSVDKYLDADSAIFKSIQANDASVEIIGVLSSPLLPLA